jgi:hypothetical protein
MPEAKIDVQYRSHRPVALAPLPAPAVIVPPFILLEEPKPPTRAQREVCMPQLEGFWTRNVNSALVFACSLGYQESNIKFAHMLNHGQALYCSSAFFEPYAEWAKGFSM